MRFLHTADWHLGKTLRHIRREEEAWEVLQEALAIAASERVDCLLLAGDVFDSVMPSPEAERLAYDFFRQLAGHGIRAVVIGGNHDHPRRLAASGRILDLVGIHVLGEPDLRGEEHNAVTVPSRDGSEAARVVMLPWVRESWVRSIDHLMDRQSLAQYAGALQQIMRRLASARRPGMANVLVAHLLVDGAIVGGEAAGERPLHMGQLYAVPPQGLPPEFDYIALGHVHRPQEVKGYPGHARYAGSIMQLDFGEEGQRKEVVLVEVDPGSGKTRVQPIPLSAGKRLMTIGSQTSPLALEELQKLASAPPAAAYLRIFIRADGPTPGLAARVRELLPNAVDVIPVRMGAQEEEERPPLRSLDPVTLLSLYHRRQYGQDPDPEVVELFRRLWHEAQHEAH